MALIREGLQIIGMVDDGDLANEFTAELQRMLATCKEHAGPKGKAKGQVTLVVTAEFEGGIVTLAGDVATKVPKKKRGSSMYWVLPDGTVSTEHPQQMSMFAGPREVGERAQS